MKETITQEDARNPREIADAIADKYVDLCIDRGVPLPKDVAHYSEEKRMWIDAYHRVEHTRTAPDEQTGLSIRRTIYNSFYETYAKRDAEPVFMFEGDEAKQMMLDWAAAHLDEESQSELVKNMDSRLKKLQDKWPYSCTGFQVKVLRGKQEGGAKIQLGVGYENISSEYNNEWIDGVVVPASEGMLEEIEGVVDRRTIEYERSKEEAEASLAGFKRQVKVGAGAITSVDDDT